MSNGKEEKEGLGGFERGEQGFNARSNLYEACSHKPPGSYYPLMLLLDALRGLILTCCWVCESNFECVAKLHWLVFHLMEGFGKLLQNLPNGKSRIFWHPSHCPTTGRQEPPANPQPALVMKEQSIPTFNVAQTMTITSNFDSIVNSTSRIRSG